MTTTPLLAWHGNPDLKAEALTTMRRHRDQDDLGRGFYAKRYPDAADGFRGCQLGCLVTEKLAAERQITVTELLDGGRSSDWHKDTQRLWGIDRRIAYVFDHTFESLPLAESRAWAVDSLEAIPVGADLGMVLSHWLLDVLADPDHGVVLRTQEGMPARKAVETVAALYRRRLAGDEPTRDEWSASADAAASAAAEVDAAAAAAEVDAYAAEVDAYAAEVDAYAAEVDAYAAEAAASAASAAYAAAEDAGAAASADAAVQVGADAEHWQWMASRLIHHLHTAPVPATAAGEMCR